MLSEKLDAGQVPLFLTDGGLETTLVFHDGYELPEFAAFPLLDTAAGRERLLTYYRAYIEIARQAGMGFVLESPTWRASARWAARLGYEAADLCRLNQKAIALMQQLKDEHQSAALPMLISGCIGPQDDGYEPQQQMDVETAERYHRPQIQTFAAAGVDMVSAVTMTYPEEAIGIANAAATAGLPAVISFTVETNGRLPVDVSLEAAIARVDREATAPPAYYMLNCAHPDHFDLAAGAPWLERIGGVRANASRMSHAELDESEVLDDGNPEEFGTLNGQLHTLLPALRVIGGCCGTDHRHIGAVAHACAH